MSTRRGLEVSRPQTEQRFWLIELPSELADELSSDSPPVLQFKSAQSTAEAALCTAEKTYRLRQVQTSNSFFVAQSTSFDNAVRRHASTVTGRLSCISKCNSYLELSNPPADSPSATSHLHALLPVYHPNDDRDNEPLAISSELGTTAKHPTRREILNDVPLNEQACQKAWSDLCAFTHDRDKSYRPSPAALLHTWTGIHSAAAESSINLSGALSLVELDQLVRETAPAGLSEAVLKFLLALPHIPECTFLDMEDDELRLDKVKVVNWVGAMLLRTRSISEEALLTQWADLLPEEWRSDARMGLLENQYVQSTTNGETVLAHVAAAVPVAATETGSASIGSSKVDVNGGKRKWHEKFKNSRKR